MNFISVKWDVGLIDLDMLSRMVLTNTTIREAFGRNN